MYAFTLTCQHFSLIFILKYTHKFIFRPNNLIVVHVDPGLQKLAAMIVVITIFTDKMSTRFEQTVLSDALPV